MYHRGGLWGAAEGGMERRGNSLERELWLDEVRQDAVIGQCGVRNLVWKKIVKSGVYYRLPSCGGDGRGRAGGEAKNMKEKNLPLRRSLEWM